MKMRTSKKKSVQHCGRRLFFFSWGEREKERERERERDKGKKDNVNVRWLVSVKSWTKADTTQNPPGQELQDNKFLVKKNCLCSISVELSAV